MLNDSDGNHGAPKETEELDRRSRVRETYRGSTQI